MHRKNVLLGVSICGALALVATVVRAGASGDGAAAPPIVVRLCDNQTTATLALAGEPTAEDGARVSAQLMAAWLAKNPNAKWDPAPPETPAVKEAHSVVPPADNKNLLGDGQSQVNTYRAVTDLDVLTWERETYQFAKDGADVFHDAKKLGSTIAVSCDMCHPDGSNTHPETYPKYQTQLGKVALLRDMINWCIEHPVRGTKLDADDPRMRGLEAYILAQRKGKTLEYGKH